MGDVGPSWGHLGRTWGQNRAAGEVKNIDFPLVCQYFLKTHIFVSESDLGAILGRSGAVLGAPGGDHGGILGHHGGILEDLGASWGDLGLPFPPPAAS